MRKGNLTRNIIISMILGLVTGSLVNYTVEKVIIDSLFSTGILSIFTLIGTLFMNSFKMMTVPIVFFSLIMGSASVGDIKKFGKMSISILSFYLFTTAIAVTIALIVATVINPGLNTDIVVETSNYVVEEPTSILTTLSSIIPENPFKSLVEGEMLQIIVFALLVGVSIATLGEKSKKLKDVIEEINDVMLNIMMLIMKIAPIGVFSLMFKVFAETGLDLILPLGKYFSAVLLTLFIQLLLVYPVLIKLFAKLSPIQFLKNAYSATAFAFSTSSSGAAIPVTMNVMSENQGVDKEISSFTIPLGATVNMDGTSVMQGVAVVLIAQLSGVELTFPMFVTVIITATIASIGTASVPSAGLVMLSMVLIEVGLDASMIGLILGIDRLLDMFRTAVNVTGDQACTVIVAKFQKALDEKVFYAQNKITTTSSDGN